MPQFLADMHIHSRYSMATSKSLGPRQLAAWGAVKGLQVVATSDFTHPGWLAEIEEALEEEDSGLLRLRDPSGLHREISWLGEDTELTPPRFILGTEISSIYKRDGAVRKVHNLVFFPGLESVRRFNQRLDRIGNLKADGRPILGLDARDLLEIALETDDRAFVIPAHIWTPWFSLFGSQSGFNSVKECFGSLSEEIFALETGLSSDPEMNWLWSELDGYRLVSNSDAHSGEKLAREANLFQGEVSYDTIHQSLKHPEKNPDFLGTVEFFPEEGKYHLDGHRACGIRLDPRETFRLNNTCPVCGKPVTVGVLNRVCRLADRNEPRKPPGSPSYRFLIPLSEVLSEILGVGTKTKKVRHLYHSLLQSHTSELNVLLKAPIPELKGISQPLAEAIRRMRSGEVHREPGFDGQFGIISAFTPEERRELHHGKRLVPGGGSGSRSSGRPDRPGSGQEGPARNEAEEEGPNSFNAEQKRAIGAEAGPLLVVAGPGTGKTRTLVGRAAHLLRNGCRPEDILVLTFTRAAAREVRQRLESDGSAKADAPRVDTLHSLAHADLSRAGTAPRIMTEEEARKLFLRANPHLGSREGRDLWQRLSLCRETLVEPDGGLREAEEAYRGEKQRHGLLDYTDLLEKWLEAKSGQRYSHVLLDEVQDLSPLQLRMVSRLCPSSGDGLFAIGDPRQSIYGFRGATGNVEDELAAYWPHARKIALDRNYRSAQNILDFASGLYRTPSPLASQRALAGELHFHQAQSDRQEAVWIAERVRELLGGTGHLQADQRDSGGLGPGDIAVLVRVKALLPQLHTTLHNHGIPCFVPERERFWEDSRIRLILASVGAALSHVPEADDVPECPEEVLDKGPAALPGVFGDRPEFDAIFWQSGPFRELSRAWREQGGWDELLNWIALERELAQVQSRSQRVALITQHAAKGLEYEAVFVPALEEGVLPLIRRRSGEPEDLEEERRLLYVALTRAKSRLYLSRASRRQLFGATSSPSPSRFLRALDWTGVTMTRSVQRTVAQEKRLRLL